MGDVLSIVAIAVLLVLVVVSVQRQRASRVHEDAELSARLGADGAQAERSAQLRAEVRAAGKD
jgi:ribosomal protein L15E